MKKLLSLVLALALLALPMTLGLAEASATDAAAATAEPAQLIAYEVTDLGFSFYYPASWNAPVADSADPTTITLTNAAGTAQMMVKQIPDAAMTTDQIVAALDTFKAKIIEQSSTAKFDDQQSGQVIKLPNGDAVQQVYYITANNVEVFSALYYLSVGKNLYLCQLSVPSSDAQVTAYLNDLGVVLGSLTAL